MGNAIPKRVVLGYRRKLAKHESMSRPESKSSSRAPLRFLSSGSYLEFLAQLPSIVDCDLEVEAK